MNPLAQDLNIAIAAGNPHIVDMLSDMGKQLYFPKGILSQSAEAKQKAHKINATIGIARQDNHVMNLGSMVSLVQEMDPETYLPYAPSFGIMELRTAWKASLYEKNPSLSGKAISLPVVTCGITHAVSTFADLWVNAGDTVLLPDMMWGNYSMTFCVRNRAKIKHYNTFTPDLKQMDLDAFEAAVKEEVRACGKVIAVLNFPHNPTGYTVSVSEAHRMADILISAASQGADVVVACDDAYFGLFYEPETMSESLFSLLAGAHERLVAVKLDGATKEEFAWGLRIGFITYGIRAGKGSDQIHDALEKKTAGCIRGCISNASHMGQSLVLQSLKSMDHARLKLEKFDILKDRAEAIRQELKSPGYSDAWDVYPFNSGYFMCIRLKDVDAETLRLHLLDNYGTGLIAIGAKNIRIAFSCLEKDDVPVLFDIILKGINDLRTKGA
ncbi:MAG: aminotransferase class I/II-fold pyridoxal phosphate-dependent enzyme [Pseudomonadota bacterium]